MKMKLNELDKVIWLWLLCYEIMGENYDRITV